MRRSRSLPGSFPELGPASRDGESAGHGSGVRRTVRGATAVATCVLLAGCASTGATFRSGVGDRFLEHPPWYGGAKLAEVAAAPGAVGHLPVAWQRGASHDPIFDPLEAGAVGALLERMNAHLDSLGLTVRLAEGGGVSAVSRAAMRVPPDVHFGCETETGAPGDDCAERDDEQALGRAGQTMWLAVGRPSPEWIAWAADAMRGAGVDRTLVITLEVGQYLMRQRGFGGTKVVELGSGHEVTFPWLTSLEEPVSVVQLTGALVGPDGRAIRIGAEGLLARRTRMAVSGVGGQELIGEEDVQALLTARRDDLPGAPLTWQTGLETLVAQLTGLGSVPGR